jgi:hypothetical protein
MFVNARGLSPCRLCGQLNGSAEYTDGTYVWPEGLAHYVMEHDVRLPDEFVSHVRRSHEGFGGSLSPEYDRAGKRGRVRGEAFLADSYDVTVNQGWWLRQRGL